MTLRDKVQVCAWLVALLLIPAVWLHFYTTWQQRNDLDRMLLRWRSDYHLNADQARQIRALEESFHGSGDPFLHPAHSAAETHEHHRAIAHIMTREDGDRFFRTMEGVSIEQ